MENHHVVYLLFMLKVRGGNHEKGTKEAEMDTFIGYI